MPSSPPDAGDRAAVRLLLALAWANVALHGAGLVAAWLWMRPGSVVSPLAERIAYLAGRPLGWTLGWGLWMLCTLLLVAYMAALRLLVPGRSLAAQLALVFTAAGMAIDLLADAVQIQVLPLAARSGQPLFLAFERLALTGGATVANGLYTAGVLLMASALGSLIGRPARLAGAATVASGAVMTLSGLLPSPVLLAASTGPTIGFYCLWAVLVARDLKLP
ncbi:MAG TPA: hypothetical protein VIJ36_18730 [Thermoanaerobaculia bacterium]